VGTVNFRLLDPNGVEMRNRQLNTSDLGTVELPMSGVYTLEVGESSNASTGTYSMWVVNVPSPDVFAISIGDVISDGVPGPGAGNIETPGVYDIYEFSAVAGQRVFFDTLSVDGVGTVNFRLLDPNGVEMRNRQLNTSDLGTVELPMSGVYTLEVGESTNASTGTYSMALYLDL